MLKKNEEKERMKEKKYNNLLNTRAVRSRRQQTFSVNENEWATATT